MDSLPKLLPIWHDIALQDSLRQSGHFYRSEHPPNYGGIGIDVNSTSSCRNLNYARKQMRFGANSCSLPFFPLRQVHSIEEPCLEALKREKFDFDKFCMKLTFVRKYAKRRKDFSDIIELQHKLNVHSVNNRSEEYNIKAPKSLVDLAENLPRRAFVPKFNVAYAGGTLGVSQSSNMLNLLHPVGEGQNKLCITPLKSDSEQKFKPDCHGQRILNLEKELILQIEPSTKEFLCVRQKNSFHVVNMANMNIFSKRVHKSSLYHVAASPYHPMEILAVYEKGMMKLINIETKKTLSITEDLYDDPSLLYPTWRCSFGSHPFSALCMNQKKTYSIDYREKTSVIKEIFSIENPSCHIGEELLAMRLWNKNPFQQLLSSSHHLIICDERYPKKPLLYWNHTLKDPPIYLEYADLDSNVSCIVIGSQESQKIASFLFTHETDIQPVLLSPPLLLSSPTDCLESLKLHCHYVDDKFFSRLSSPLTGVCIAPDVKETAFTVLQSTSLGDIFYQDFKQSESIEKTYCVSTGCILTPPEKILPHVKELISGSTDANEEPENLDEAITRLEINIKDILSSPKQISANCTVCRSRNSSDEKELVFSEICPSCNLNSAQSQQFSKAETTASAIIGPISEESSGLDCDMDYLSGFEDTYSKRILSVWLESDDLEDREISYDQSVVFGDL